MVSEVCKQLCGRCFVAFVILSLLVGALSTFCSPRLIWFQFLAGSLLLCCLVRVELNLWSLRLYSLLLKSVQFYVARLLRLLCPTRIPLLLFYLESDLNFFMFKKIP